VSAVSGIGSTTTTTDTTSTAGTGLQGNKDEFLKLFMAQLQHQDPLNPTSGADMVSQLAQFGAVEQAQQANQQLSEISASQQSAASAQLANLVGRDCQVAVGDVSLTATGTPPPISLTSDQPMAGAVVVVTDADGKEIRRFTVPAGTSATVQWDGTDANGQRVAAGDYHIDVQPGTSAGTITAQWSGVVDAVELTSDGPRLRMGGILVTPADVRTIGTNQTAGVFPQGDSQ
jgi:flagellar basal-body rod modification protein FlgD